MAPPTTEVSGNLLLIKDPDQTLVVTMGGSQSIDWVGAYNVFRSVFGDDYDFVGFFIDVASGMPNNLGAAEFPVYNDVTGIGMQTFNNRASYDNSSKLLGISWYGQATPMGMVLVQMSELLHELGHHWLAAVNYKDSSNTTQTLLHQDWVWNPGQSGIHWGRWPDKGNSSMGYDQAQWIDNGGGTWNRYQRDTTQAVDDAWFGYWALDQYLMGFLPSSAVPTIDIIQNPNPAIPPAWPAWHSSTGPYTPTPSLAQITVANVQAEEGVRNPDYLGSQRVFHQGFAIITKSTAAAGANPFVATCEGWRAGHTTNFRGKTAGQAMIDTSLLRSNFSDLYVKDNDADTGGASSSGVFWLSPDLWVRNIQDGGTTNQNTIRGQDNYIYVRVRNKGLQPYDNVSVNVYLGNFDTVVPGSQFLYPPDWNPAGLIANIPVGTVPAATAAGDGTTVVSVIWPKSQIPPAMGWHPCLLCEVIPMETTPSGLHMVFQNKKLAQRNITIV